MKIIEIIPQLSQGGAERFVIDLCNQLSRNHEVILVVLHKLDHYGFFLHDLAANVKLVCMEKELGFDRNLSFKLHRLLKLEKPDVVHTHLRAFTYILYSAFAYTAPNYFHTVHNQSPEEADGKLGLILRKIAFTTHKIVPVTISEDSQRSFEQTYHTNSLLIYNGRPPLQQNLQLQKQAEKEMEAFMQKGQCLTILNVARIDTAKNQLTLAQAVHEINAESHKHVELLIIGRKENKEIINQIETLRSPYVHLLGEREEPRHYMDKADAFCLPSIYEGMPITLIECFSVGCIPLCTPTGGIKNMIKDGVNGMLASGGYDKASIKQLLLRFLQLNEQEKENIRKQSMASYKKYTMSTCASEYEKAFLGTPQ